MLKYLKSTVAVATVLGAVLLTPAQAQDASELALRMSQLEEQVRQLTGQVEQLTFEIKRIKSAKAGSGVDVEGQALPPKKKMAAASSDAIESQPLEPLDNAEPLTQGAEEILPLPKKATLEEDGSGLQKAPPPAVLGSMNNKAAAPDDGGFQGQVLVAPSQQEGVVILQEPAIEQGTLDGDDGVEQVALAQDSPDALYEKSNESLLRRQFGDAEAGFRTFLDKYPDHNLAGNAQYWLGETFYAQADYRQAAQAFLKGYQQYPKSRRAADSLLKLGISLNKLGQKDKACAVLGTVGSEYPKAVEARKRAQAEASRAGCA
jgi:tol-pal system protein YbgF